MLDFFTNAKCCAISSVETTHFIDKLFLRLQLLIYTSINVSTITNMALFLH